MQSLDQMLSLVPEIANRVKSQPAPVFVPAELSLAWNAIPVLAFNSFPSGVSQLKKDLENDFEAIKTNGKNYRLAKENMGSRWPKVSLGALRDGEYLSLDDARAVKSICDELLPSVQNSPAFIAEELRVVVLECRSLEKRLLSYPIPYHDRSSDDNPPNIILDDKYNDEDLKYVRWVLSGFTWSGMESYWKKGLTTGKGTETRYRERHFEATLVVDLNGAYGKFIEQFIAAVDSRVKARFCWFRPDSRHITLRNLHYE